MQSLDSASVTRFSGLIFYGLLLLMLLIELISPYDLLVLLWAELIVIGLFTLLKMAVTLVFGDPFSGRYVDTSRGATLLFGAIAMGIFVFMFGAIVFGIGFMVLWAPLDDAIPQTELGELGLWVELCCWYLLVSYVLNFVWQFLRHKEYQRVSVGWLLISPYLRGTVIGISLMVASLADIPFDGFAFCVVLVLLNAILNLRYSAVPPPASPIAA